MNNKKQIFLSLAMFVALMWGADAAAQTVLDINGQIRELRTRIEDSRKRAANRTRSALRRNPHYRYVTEYRAETDSLRRVNEEILTRAQQHIRKQKRMTIVTRNPMLFHLHPGELRSLRGLYEINCKRIEKYERHLRALDGVEIKIKNHFDSIMHADIDQYQMMIDSLLNKKYELIR